MFNVSADEGNILHLSQACLHEPVYGKNFVQVVEHGTRYAIACLGEGKQEFATFDLFFRTAQCGLANTGSSEAHLTGYFEPEGCGDEREEEAEEE